MKELTKCYCGHTTTCDCGPETLEEVAEIITTTKFSWQQERSYSEEEIKQAFKVGFSIGYGSDVHAIDEKNRTCDEWFEQFKKK